MIWNSDSDIPDEGMLLFTEDYKSLASNIIQAAELLIMVTTGFLMIVLKRRHNQLLYLFNQLLEFIRKYNGKLFQNIVIVFIITLF